MKTDLNVLGILLNDVTKYHKTIECTLDVSKKHRMNLHLDLSLILALIKNLNCNLKIQNTENCKESMFVILGQKLNNSYYRRRF